MRLRGTEWREQDRTDNRTEASRSSNANRLSSHSMTEEKIQKMTLTQNKKERDQVRSWDRRDVRPAFSHLQKP